VSAAIGVRASVAGPSKTKHGEWDRQNAKFTKRREEEE
jgi:hypothetical protein